MSLTGGRREFRRYDLLDLSDRVIGTLDGVTGGTIEGSIFNAIRSGGSVSVVDTDEIDWLTTRLGITYGEHTADEDETYPIGVYVVSAPSISATPGSSARTLTLLDKLSLLVEDKTDHSYVVAAAVVVTDAIATLLAGQRSTVTTSTETLDTAMVWPAGTAKLTIVNALLGAIGYFALSADASGALVASPYLAPEDRPVTWELIDGTNALYKPTFSVSSERFSVPNKVVLVRTTPEGELTSTAVLDPASPYSYESRGRWITDVRTDTEATSQEVLDAKTATILADAQRITETITVSHPYLPFGLHDVVRFRSLRLGLDGNYAVSKQRHDLKTGDLVTSTLRRTL